MEEQEYLDFLMDPEFSHTLSCFANVIGQLKDAHVIMGLNTTTEHKYNLLVQLVNDSKDAFGQIHVTSISTTLSSTDREEMLEELYTRIDETIETLEQIIA